MSTAVPTPRPTAHAAPVVPKVPAAPAVSLRQALPWLVLSLLLAVVGMYFVGAEQGATALLSGNAVHEWVHDSRHLLGFPCH